MSAYTQFLAGACFSRTLKQQEFLASGTFTSSEALLSTGGVVMVRDAVAGGASNGTDRVGRGASGGGNGGSGRVIVYWHE